MGVESGMSYENGVATIFNRQGKMWFPMSDTDAGKIIRRCIETYEDFIDETDLPTDVQKKIEKLSGVNSAEAAKEHLLLCGYKEVLHKDGITLYVKCLMKEMNLYGFRYVSDSLPNTHGSTAVNITLQIEHR